MLFCVFVRVLVLAVISHLFLLIPWAGCALCLSHVLLVFTFFLFFFPIVFKKCVKNNGLVSLASLIGV